MGRDHDNGRPAAAMKRETRRVPKWEGEGSVKVCDSVHSGWGVPAANIHFSSERVWPIIAGPAPLNRPKGLQNT